MQWTNTNMKLSIPLVSLINEIKTLSNGNFLDRVLDSSQDSNNSISPIMTNLYRLPVKHGTGNPGMEWGMRKPGIVKAGICKTWKL